MMAEHDIKIAGHEFKRWQVWTVGVGGAGVTYLIYRQRKAAAAAATSSATGTDPTTGLPASEDNQIDPETGETYLGEAEQYGSVSAAEAAAASGAGYDTSAYGSVGSYGTTAGAGLSGSTVLGTTGNQSYASNADWDQAVTAGLSEIGYSETDVAAALGRYLGSLSLDPDQQNIVNVALAEFGPPPTGSFSIIAGASTGTATTGSTGTTTTTTTGTGTGTATGTGTGSGTGTTAAAALSKVTAGKATTTANGAVVSWTATGPAKSWQVTINGPNENGKQVVVTKPQATYSGLLSGHNYTVSVQPLPSGTGGLIEVKTK